MSLVPFESSDNRQLAQQHLGRRDQRELARHIYLVEALNRLEYYRRVNGLEQLDDLSRRVYDKTMAFGELLFADMVANDNPMVQLAQERHWQMWLMVAETLLTGFASSFRSR
jgi:hypothetical protein